MAKWHERRDVDLGLRTSGLLLAVAAHGLALLLTHHLHGHPANDATAIDLLLAAGLFLSASAGTALLIVGRHLFDEVRVSERWMRRPPSS